MALEKEALQYVFFGAVLVFLSLYFVFEAYLEQNRPKFGHTTGIIVCMGILFSYLIYKIAEANPDEKVVLDELRFS